MTPLNKPNIHMFPLTPLCSPHLDLCNGVHQKNQEEDLIIRIMSNCKNLCEQWTSFACIQIIPIVHQCTIIHTSTPVCTLMHQCTSASVHHLIARVTPSTSVHHLIARVTPSTAYYCGGVTKAAVNKKMGKPWQTSQPLAIALATPPW